MLSCLRFATLTRYTGYIRELTSILEPILLESDQPVPSPCSTLGKCPMDALLSVLAGPWTMYILWVLRRDGPTRFAALRRKIEGISSKVLTERLRMLESEGLVYRHYEPTVPPQVTYSLTERMGELAPVLDQLNEVARRWYTPAATEASLAQAS